MSRHHLPHGLLLALALSSLFLLRLNQPIIERQQELRVALAARSIIDSGNWLLPQFQQNLRIRKPPLMTWLTTTAYLLSGHNTTSPAPARTISALAALLALLLIHRWVKHTHDPQTAWWAVAGLGTSFLFIRHARSAETDMLLSLLILISIHQIFHLTQRHTQNKNTPHLHHWLILGAAMGLGFMTKGPAAIIIPLLTLALTWKKIHLPPKTKTTHLLLALLLTLLLAAPWYIYISQFLAQSPQANLALKKELSATFIKTAHPGNLLYYLYTLPWMMLPTSLLLPIALKNLLKKQQHPLTAFTRTWFLITLTLLTLTPSKQAHYTLLLILPASLLIAPHLKNLSTRHRHLPKAILLLPTLLLQAYLQWASPHINPNHHLPQFLTPLRPAAHQAKHIHTIGINSAIIEFYLRLHVHPTDNLDYALRRAYPSDLIIGIGKKNKLNQNRPLPKNPTQIQHHLHSTYILYTIPPKKNSKTPHHSTKQPNTP